MEGMTVLIKTAILSGPGPIMDPNSSRFLGEYSRVSRDVAENLLHDVAVELIERAKEAKQEAASSRADYDKGRHFALYEVVSLIRQQAEVFGLPAERIGLDTLDVDRDLL